MEAPGGGPGGGPGGVNSPARPSKAGFIEGFRERMSSFPGVVVVGKLGFVKSLLFSLLA